MEPRKLISAKDLADRLGLDRDTILVWHRRGYIPALRLTKKLIRFDPDLVIEAMRLRLEKAS